MTEIMPHGSGHMDALTNEVTQLRQSLSQEKAKLHAERRKCAAQLASIQKRFRSFNSRMLSETFLKFQLIQSLHCSLTRICLSFEQEQRRLTAEASRANARAAELQVLKYSISDDFIKE